MRELRDKPLSRFALKIRNCLNSSNEIDGPFRLARTSPTDTVAYGVQEDGYQYTVAIIKMPKPRVEPVDTEDKMIAAESAFEPTGG